MFSGWTTAPAGSDIGVFADAVLYAIKAVQQEDSPSSMTTPHSRPNSRELYPIDDRFPSVRSDRTPFYDGGFAHPAAQATVQKPS